MSYGDVEGLRTYAEDRGGSDLGDDASVSTALVRANDYIEFFYVAHFASFPGEDVITKAVYEAARIEVNTPNFFNKSYTPSEAKVLTQVEGIKWERVGGVGGAEALMPTSTMIEAMLGQYTARHRGLGMRALG